MNRWILLLGLIATNMTLYADTLQVRHNHEPWGKCEGTLTIGPGGIEFVSGKERHSRTWNWIEIQGFDRRSPMRFSVMTYEDEALRPGLDRHYDFRVLPDTRPLQEASFALISSRLARPVTDRVQAEGATGYRIPVKHLHAAGGCQGTLTIDQDRITFAASAPRHNRTWLRGKDIQSVWSQHRYQLEVHIFEPNRRNAQAIRAFRFKLKEPLQKSFYEDLRRELAADW